VFDGFERPRFFRWRLRREGVRDRERLERELPAFSGLKARIARHERELERDWLEYVGEVSRAEISCTLGGAALWAAIAEVRKPRAILDLGSGFSSFVFRKSGARVKSVDDQPAWLERTRAFLAAKRLPVEELCALDQLGAADRGAYDLVFYDLGSMETRERHLETALAAAAPAGWIVLDDCHKARFWKQVESARSVARFRLYSLRDYAVDIWGRFSVLLVSGSRTP
jgi:predicted O-methyltransferase YrrM